MLIVSVSRAGYLYLYETDSELLPFLSLPLAAARLDISEVGRLDLVLEDRGEQLTVVTENQEKAERMKTLLLLSATWGQVAAVLS